MLSFLWIQMNMTVRKYCTRQEKGGQSCVKDFRFPDEWKIRSGGWKVFDCTIPGDIRAIEVLKMFGVRVNFPNPISLKYAEENVESMKDELPLWQFKLVAESIGSLREKMMKNGLHHDYILLA